VSPTETVDAVVIGAGANGLVAANLLADHGWDVLVLEEQDEPGGAVRSAELTRPGFVHDVFSAFYPLAIGSPILRALDLEAYGLRWSRAPVVVAHAARDGCPYLSTDLDETAAAFDSGAPGDGDAWRRLYGRWLGIEGPFIDAILGPFPPLRAGLRLGARLRPPRNVVRFARFCLLPIRRLAAEEFRGPDPGLLMAGNALHSDLAPEAPLSGFFGWLLTSLGQRYGFPVPLGGAGRLTDAIVARLRSAGGEVRCGERVDRIAVRQGRAVGVSTATGVRIRARRAVLADVDAPTLFRSLVGDEHLPADVVGDLDRFEFDNATVKVDWALSRPVPWIHEPARRAGTVHVADGMDHLTENAALIARGCVPSRPHLVVGQMTTSDASRSPSGTEQAWAYTHVPQHVRGDAAGSLSGSWSRSEVEAFGDRIEEQIERLAPGFRSSILQRHLMGPRDLFERDANLEGGAVNGGTANLYQQLVFRPTPGFARPETPIRRLYLASASAHPGGGVHGACGANAAHAALLHASPASAAIHMIRPRRLG
jgi:phytoene dehydrogenase-like protein